MIAPIFIGVAIALVGRDAAPAEIIAVYSAEAARVVATILSTGCPVWQADVDVLLPRTQDRGAAQARISAWRASAFSRLSYDRDDSTCCGMLEREA